MRTTCLSLVLCLFAAAVPARAGGIAVGATFAIGIAGLPADAYNCQNLAATVALEVYDDGTSRRKSILVTTWVETPFGRAVLDQQVRRVLPGQRVAVRVAFDTRCPTAPRPGTGDATELTFGVTATLKGETLEVERTLTYHDAEPPH